MKHKQGGRVKYPSRKNQNTNKRPPGYNSSESPLVRLYSRKLPSGHSYISQNQLRAGEQIRKDFECGQLQPRITATLERSIGKVSNRSGLISGVEISDFAIDARERVNRAIQILGPELSGIVIDVCCFLKGLEIVEKERQWPPRSAKLMLRTGLSILARHYGFESIQDSEKSAIRSWGSEGYRPNFRTFD